jgi:hypothetical protein
MDEPKAEVLEIKEEEKPVVKTPTFKNKFFKKNFLIIFGIILVVFIFGGLFVLGNSQPQISSEGSSQDTVTPTPESGVTLAPGVTAEASPECQHDTLELTNRKPCASYYNFGTIAEGKYKGYKRIVASIEGVGYPDYLLATLDNKTYVLDKSSAGDYIDPYSVFDKSKVIAVDNLSSNFPQVINLNDKFALFRRDIYHASGYSATGVYEDQMMQGYSDYISLSSDNPSLKYYTEKYKVNLPDKDQAVKNLYFNHDTEIIVVDSGGLGYSYILTTPQKIDEYNKASAIAKAKTPVEYVASPNLSFTKSDTDITQPIYEEYNSSFPGACGGNMFTYVFKNLQDNQFTKLGTLKNGIDLFTLSDNSVQLLALSYNYKVAVTTDDIWSQVNKVPKPSYDQYIAKNPLIFFKDPWGNWVANGEYDYYLMGGCGKPVVYLYPKKPTEVSVKFASAIKFDVDIPTYSNGWKVLANPNGTLTDLNPKATDCSKIDFARTGSEYAKTICSSGKYPYLYWAGRSLERTYPQLNEGWIVTKADLSTFLNKKLDEIGLNKTEKKDMLTYWLPQLQKKNASYYRISFLQNAEMNHLVPMVVTPRPDSVLRVFLDYQALDSKPTTILKPQTLTKFNRSGFTMVEWGGLEK